MLMIEIVGTSFLLRVGFRMNDKVINT
jgi:hypothetical protein